MKIAVDSGIMSSLFRSRHIKTKRGFTLLELMVVIGIIAIGLAIGIPVYHTTIKPTARLNGAARQVYSDIQLARMRAVSENGRCGLAFSAGPTHTVFRDNTPANSQYDVGAEEVIKTVNLASEYPNIQFDTSQGGGDGISFANDSFSMTPRGVATIGGTVYLINEKGEGRRIVVNNVGGVRIEKY
jgi:prepilin-type N-terminal cleavage/methylation domain-containing protein